MTRVTAAAAASLILATSACGSSSALPATDTAVAAAPATSASTATEIPSVSTVPDVAATNPSSSTSSSTTSTTAPEPAPIVVTDARGVTVTIASTERIIPLDGDVAEIVFALGFGEHVVATDLSATYPAEADALPQIGYQRALTAEPIVAFEPTLLIATDIAGPPETLDDLERIGVPLVIVPNDAAADGPARKINAVAAALGVPELGAQLAAALNAGIADAIAGVPERSAPPRVVTLYLRGTSTQLVLGSSYSSHWLIEAAGGIDIAVELGVDQSAPITDEALIAAAPDAILVTDSGLASIGGLDELFSAIPALAQTPAGRTRTVLAYDDQLLLGNGPRTGDLLASLVHDLASTGSDP